MDLKHALLDLPGHELRVAEIHMKLHQVLVPDELTLHRLVNHRLAELQQRPVFEEEDPGARPAMIACKNLTRLG